MTKGRWALLALLIVGALAALEYAREHRAKLTSSSTATVRLFREPLEVPAFNLTDLDGRPLASSDWRGKVVLLNFWATWCPPCRAEIPDLVALQEKYRDQLVIIGVSEDEGSPEEVKRFVVENKMSYPVVMSTPELRKIFKGVVALPTTFVINREGKVEQRHVGMIDPAGVEAEARVLAGLDLNASIERIENSAKVRLENAAQAKKIPGVDLSNLSEAQTKAVVQALLAEDCTCGCTLTVAECRLEDPTCPISLPLAQNIVKQYSARP